MGDSSLLNWVQHTIFAIPQYDIYVEPGSSSLKHDKSTILSSHLSKMFKFVYRGNTTVLSEPVEPNPHVYIPLS